MFIDLIFIYCAESPETSLLAWIFLKLAVSMVIEPVCNNLNISSLILILEKLPFLIFKDLAYINPPLTIDENYRSLYY